MITSIIPKFLFQEEDILFLKDKGIKFEEGNYNLTKYKIPCYKFYNLSETEVFDELEKPLLHEIVSTEVEKSAYANRVTSILFLRVRQVAAIDDKNERLTAACALTSAVNSLATININYAKRFLPLLRSLA